MKLDLKLEIEPYRGIANLRFGMVPDQIHEILGGKVQTFQKVPNEYPTDNFDELGIHVFYKQPGVCEAIELASPANPTFQDKELIGKPFSELRNWMQTIDPTVEIDEAGLTSHQFGIGFYAPFAVESPDDPVEAVIVFAKGYYDICV
jgi:hypothetical protein